MERTTITEMLDHCMENIRRHPYNKIGLEHFVFMKLLEKCTSAEFEEIVNMYRWIIKEETE